MTKTDETEAMIFRAFVLTGADELKRFQIIDALVPRNADTRWQSAMISRIDAALAVLTAQQRLVRQRRGMFSILGRMWGARNPTVTSLRRPPSATPTG